MSGTRRAAPSRVRRLTAVTLLALALVGVAASLSACSGGAASGASGTPPPTAAPAPGVKAWSGIVMDRRSGVVLWSKAPNRRLSPASCTKIMTCLLVLERVKDQSRYARVPAIPLPQNVSVKLRPGDRITIKQALRALMVKSANDAALTLASYVAGSEKRFVKLMNARAARLGLRNTHFRNCRGTPVPGHYSSAADLARLARYAMRKARFRELVRIRKTVIRYPPDNAVTVENHNRLLEYDWCDGIKTGATAESGMVLVGSGKPGLAPLIVVTMHQPNRAQEVRDALALFTWGSGLFEKKDVVTAGAAVTTVPVDGGGEVILTAAATLTAVVRTAAPVTTKLSVPASLPSLPAAGSFVGRATYTSDGLVLGRVDLVAAASASPPASPAP